MTNLNSLLSLQALSVANAIGFFKIVQKNAYIFITFLNVLRKIVKMF